MNTLQLFIDAGWPQQHTDGPWRLLNPLGKLLASGRSEPAHWPGVVTESPPSSAEATVAHACEVVLSNDQGAYFDIELPPGKAGLQRDVVAFALEDKLLDDLDRYHFALGSRQGDGCSAVVAMAQPRLRQILDNLTSIGLSPHRAVMAAQLQALPVDGWLLVAEHGHTSLITSAGWLPVNHIERTSPPVELLIAQSATPDDRAKPIYLSGDIGGLIDTAAWNKLLGRPVTAESPAATLPAEPINLLQGEFAPARAPHPLWHQRRLIARLGAAVLAVYALLSLGEWAWLAREARQLREQQTAVFRDTFPQVSAIVMPSLQLRRNLDEERHRHGLSGEEDFLALTNALGTAGVTQAEELRYSPGRLDAVVTLPSRERIDPLLLALRLQGLVVTPGKIDPAGQGVRLQLSLRRGGMQ
jgi:general secretion pathway protein L